MNIRGIQDGKLTPTLPLGCLKMRMLQGQQSVLASIKPSMLCCPWMLLKLLLYVLFDELGDEIKGRAQLILLFATALG
jgi:hypothetical protein